MKNIISLAIAALALAGCTSQTSGSTDAPGSCNALSSSAGIQSLLHPQTLSLNSNQASLLVGGNYVNEITTSVTICEPGTTNCQTIPDVLVDTGSNGLRLFKCSIIVNLPNVTDSSGNDYGTCVTYADTSSHWGPVKTADVQLGSEKALNVPIQVIDADFGTVPPTCTNLETDPQATGYNGIVGVGLLANDCPTCVTAAYDQNPQYYSCNGSGCTYTCYNGNCQYTKGANIVSAKQVTNPVSMMPIDNNGVLLTIPNVSAGGAGSVTGTLTLGIGTGTTADNIPNANVKTFTANSSLEFTTNFSGTSPALNSAFIDSGSNAYYFPDSTLATCNISNFEFYCPNGTTPLNATMISNTGGTQNSTPFIVTSAELAVSTSNSNFVFPGFSGSAVSGGGFDWGLPFFMGRTVYVGITSTSAVSSGAINSAGPFWAYDTSVSPSY